MSYPNLEQYNTALQHPATAFLDPQLRVGKVKTTGLGLPHALCGGFALTYTIDANGKRYAVRCFHKQSNSLEQRYRSISNRLHQLKSPYFLNFEYQSQGVRVEGNSTAYPIVKMDWATGTTLGQFIEKNYRNKNKLETLSSSLRTLASYLEQHRLAHGDIQTGNLIVSNDGRNIQLIDYDGIYTDDLKNLGSAELGHRNFQHPRRNSNDWDKTLDRFSFITLNFALRILCERPELWDTTKSESDGTILFRANDFVYPDQSDIFIVLLKDSKFADEAKRFAAICKAPLNKVPSLDDYLTGRNIPSIAALQSPKSFVAKQNYISAYPVLDAKDYALCMKYIGDKVELIGQIVEVKESFTRYKKPYIHVNFGKHKDDIVQIVIWSEGLAKLSVPIDRTWIGKWVSAKGLMNPAYHSNKYNYTHLSITLTETGQIQELTAQEAQYRFTALQDHATPNPTESSLNQRILESIHQTACSPEIITPPITSPVVSPAPTAPNTVASNQVLNKTVSNNSTLHAQSQSQPQTTKNQEILRNMRSSGTSSGAQQPSIHQTILASSQTNLNVASLPNPATQLANTQIAAPTSPIQQVGPSKPVPSNKATNWPLIVLVFIVLLACFLLVLAIGRL